MKLTVACGARSLSARRWAAPTLGRLQERFPFNKLEANRGDRVPGFEDRITIDPALRSGKPVIRGTRITVSDILEYLAGGMSQDEILADFPDLSAEDIRAALAFAAARERRLFSFS